MKTIAIGLCAAMLAAMLPACSKSAKPAGNSKTLTILCSTFPMYLFTRAVTDGRADVDVQLMLPATTGCPHNYSLTPQDMLKIAGAKVFVANGLGMEEYLGEPLKRANGKIIVIDTSAGIGDLIPLKEAGPDAHEAGHAEHHHHSGDNPHLFASPRMAGRIVRNIAAELSKIDPDGAAVYTKNAEAYSAKLDALADDFAAALKDAPNKNIVTEHAIFDYLARDCGLHVAAVIEEHPGKEPVAADMKDIIDTIKSSGAVAVFTEPQYTAMVTKTIAANAGIPVAKLDPVATGPADAGADYYEETMRQNLKTLKTMLKVK
ncbi:MAG: zinc ABC transporter substrate-binding protein [Planctomycetaceae bacterium]|nr:MAG: zinc ABC transporter substrate-binding protein [Planctomycetaceae bacterium]